MQKLVRLLFNLVNLIRKEVLKISLCKLLFFVNNSPVKFVYNQVRSPRTASVCSKKNLGSKENLGVKLKGRICAELCLKL